MIKINLLPKRLARTAVKFTLYAFVFFGIVNACVLGAIYYGNSREIDEYMLRIENGKKEISSLDGVYREYMRIEKDKKEAADRLKAVDSLKQGRALAARILYDLTSLVKERVWLRTFKRDSDRFEMEGRSLENESISELLETLAKIPYMKNVELRNVEDVTEGGITVKKFIIYGNIGL